MTMKYYCRSCNREFLLDKTVGEHYVEKQGIYYQRHRIEDCDEVEERDKANPT